VRCEVNAPIFFFLESPHSRSLNEDSLPAAIVGVQLRAYRSEGAFEGVLLGGMVTGKAPGGSTAPSGCDRQSETFRGPADFDARSVVGDDPTKQRSSTAPSASEGAARGNLHCGPSSIPATSRGDHRLYGPHTRLRVAREPGLLGGLQRLSTVLGANSAGHDHHRRFFKIGAGPVLPRPADRRSPVRNKPAGWEYLLGRPGSLGPSSGSIV